MKENRLSLKEEKLMNNQFKIHNSKFITILVTGGAGFIGSNFIRYVFKKTDFKGKIVNIDKLTYAANPMNLQDISQKYKDRYFFEHADICDYDSLVKIFKRYNITNVVHFAAESHVDRSILGPKDFIQTNIVGTFNLLEASKKYWMEGPFKYRSQYLNGMVNDELGIMNEDNDKLINNSKFKIQNSKFLPRFHHISTDEVYGSLGKEGLFHENTPYDPRSPYSASKASSDHLVRAYYHTYGLPVSISNCSNNYGPYQFPEKLIPLVIINALEGKAIPIYGDGKNIRDWLYVEDHCSAIWSILSKGKIGETYNIGGRNERTNLKIVDTICEILDELYPIKHSKFNTQHSILSSYKSLITFVEDRPGHDRRYGIDASKIERELGWKPDVDFNEGMRKTVKWYLENPQWIENIKSGEYLKWIDKNYTKRQ